MKFLVALSFLVMFPFALLKVGFEAAATFIEYHLFKGE
jgi:hypothetical protein